MSTFFFLISLHVNLDITNVGKASTPPCTCSGRDVTKRYGTGTSCKATNAYIYIEEVVQISYYHRCPFLGQPWMFLSQHLYVSILPWLGARVLVISTKVEDILIN